MALDMKLKSYDLRRAKPEPFLTDVMTGPELSAVLLGKAAVVEAAARGFAAVHRDTGEYLSSFSTDLEIEAGRTPRVVVRVTNAVPADETGFLLSPWMEMKHRIMWRALLAAQS